MEPRHLDFLRSVQAHTQAHGNRTLLDHLTGTLELLQQWGTPEHIRVAGLFHSIYGTNVFKPQSVSVKQRGKLRSVIGRTAERLVYLFAATSRPASLLEALDSGRLDDRFTGIPVPVEPSTIEALLAVECANLLEQGSGKGFFPRLAQWLEAHPEFSAPLLRTALDAHAARSPPVAPAQPATASATAPARLTLRVRRQPSRHVPSSSLIRRATPADLDQLLGLSRQLHVDSRYAWMHYQKDKVRQRLAQFITAEQSCAAVAERHGDLCGFLLGTNDTFPFANAAVATCRLLYVSPQTRGVLSLRLLQFFRSWAHKAGAQELRVDDCFGADIERSEVLFQRLGLSKAGAIHSVWL